MIDNLDDAPNRCIEPSLLSFRKSMIINQIKSLLAGFEYKGAYDLICANETMFTENLKMLLHHGYLRSLPHKNAEAVAKALGQDIYKQLYPFSNRDLIEVIDYYRVAELRKKQNKLTDFILRVTALAEHLIPVHVGKTLGSMEAIAHKRANGGWMINTEKIQKQYPELLNYLQNEYRGQELRISIGLAMLEHITNFFKINDGYAKLFAIRKLRNDSSHGLESVTEADLAKVGTSSKELLKQLNILIMKSHGIPAVPDIFGFVDSKVLEEL